MAAANNSNTYVTASAAEIDEFMNSALVTWLESCLNRPEILNSYASLLDGKIIHSVWLQIDPEPTMNPVEINELSETSLPMLRAKNFECIIRNLKQLFEEELDQTILVLPDWFILGYYSETKQGLEQMKLLLTLLLGAAVQSPNKEMFIARIKNLNIDRQHSIVEFIKQVTDKDCLVLTVESLDRLTANEMYNHILRLSKERDSLQEKWIYAKCLEQQLSGAELNENAAIKGAPLNAALSEIAASTLALTNVDKNHTAVEVADLKSKLRKLRHELEEKSECNLELRELLEDKRAQYEKLRVESQEWRSEAKRSATYRDELDVLRERAERVERLEIEVQKYKEKLTDSEFYKMRMEELREDNRMMLEAKDILEEQLQRWRKRSEHVTILESEIVKYKQKLNDMALEHDADRTRLEELIEENTQLQLAAKNVRVTEALNNSLTDINNDAMCNVGDNSLSEQLNNSAQTRALKLELENRHLTAALDQLKETAFHESTAKILELEKEKKKMSLRIEQLQENNQRFTKQNAELEELFQNALSENKKMQDNMDERQKNYEKLMHDYEVERCKVMDLEKHVETVDKEKQRIQNFNDSIQRRADDLEVMLNARAKEIEHYSDKLKLYEQTKQTVHSLQEKLNKYERENAAFLREIAKLKESLEKKSQLLEQKDIEIDKQAKEVSGLSKTLAETEEIKTHIANLQIQNKELLSQKDIQLQTIATLRNDLVDRTLAQNKVCRNLEKLGITVNPDDIQTDLNTETVVENLIRNPETFKTVCEVMLNVSKEKLNKSSNNNTTNKSDICILCHRKEIFTVEKNIHLSPTPSPSSSSTKSNNFERIINLNNRLVESETWETDNARLKVDVATLGSQVASLNTQHVSLQLANSHLANDKDVLLKENETLKQTQKNLLHDHVTLQCLHDQLSAEYECLNKDKEELKMLIRDLKNDSRDMRRYINTLELQVDDLKCENNSMKSCSEDLNILRKEHSKLTDDFRILFATSDRFKNEYKNIQEQYKLIRAENSKLKLQTSELTGELNSHNDQIQMLQNQYVKSAQCCEMLIQQNANLDVERKTLMENVSHLLKQYHELLTYSLDDKKHFHEEEKSYTECIHNLSRQKEKLEEKIMELFKKSETVLTKKKPFASSLVRRVKKASTDLMNKVPNRHRRSWNDDSRLTQSKFMIDFESGGNDSDNSTEEIISRHSDMHSLPSRHCSQPLEAPDVMSSNLTMEAAGSRRTVYLFDEHQKIPETSTSTSPTTNLDDDLADSNNSSPPNVHILNKTSEPKTQNNDNSSTFLIYNRLNTTVGGPTPNLNETDNKDLMRKGNNQENDKTNENKTVHKHTDDKNNSIWYEYGCV